MKIGTQETAKHRSPCPFYHSFYEFSLLYEHGIRLCRFFLSLYSQWTRESYTHNFSSSRSFWTWDSYVTTSDDEQMSGMFLIRFNNSTLWWFPFWCFEALFVAYWMSCRLSSKWNGFSKTVILNFHILWSCLLGSIGRRNWDFQFPNKFVSAVF